MGGSVEAVWARPRRRHPPLPFPDLGETPLSPPASPCGISVPWRDPPVFLRYRFPATPPLPSRCNGQRPGSAGSPSPVPGGRCGFPAAPFRSSGGAPSPPAPAVRVSPPTPSHSPGPGPPCGGGSGDTEPPHPRRPAGGLPGGAGGVLAAGTVGSPPGAGPGGAGPVSPPCVRPRRKWPGNGSRLLRLVVFETSFLIRSRHAPGASRCHRAGGAAEPGWDELSARGMALAPRHRQSPSSLELCPPPAQLLGTVPAPVSPRGSQGAVGAAATGFDTRASVAATLAVPGVTGVGVSPGLGVTHHHRGSQVLPSPGSCPLPSSPRPAPVSCRGPVSAPHSVAQGGGSRAAGALVWVGGDGWPWVAVDGHGWPVSTMHLALPELPAMPRAALASAGPGLSLEQG